MDWLHGKLSMKTLRHTIILRLEMDDYLYLRTAYNMWFQICARFIKFLDCVLSFSWKCMWYNSCLTFSK